jgi:hypothetical protein
MPFMIRATIESRLPPSVTVIATTAPKTILVTGIAGM